MDTSNKGSGAVPADCVHEMEFCLWLLRETDGTQSPKLIRMTASRFRLHSAFAAKDIPLSTFAGGFRTSPS